MKKLYDWIALVVALPALALLFAFFHVVQLGVYFFGSPAAHRRWVVRWARACIGFVSVFFGVRVDLSAPLPPEIEGRPFIVVANHQSPLDIVLILAYFALRYPRFVCRSGLERGIPCVSFFVRHGGQVILKKFDRAHNWRALRAVAARCADERSGVIIFPEGRKDKDRYQYLGRFRRNGLRQMLAAAPDAVVLPLVIKGARDAWPYGLRPPVRGARIHLVPLAPVTHARDHEAVIDHCEIAIRQALGLRPLVEIPRPLLDTNEFEASLPCPDASSSRTGASLSRTDAIAHAGGGLWTLRPTR